MNRSRERLGDLMVNAGLITPAQRDQALELAKQKNIKIGEAVVALGYATKNEVASSLAKQLGLTYAGDSSVKVNPKAVELVPERVARRLRVVPVDLKENKLVVAIDDPTNLLAVDQVSMLTGMNTEAIVVTEEQLSALIDLAYARAPSPAFPVPEKPDQTGATPDTSPVVNLINSIIEDAVSKRASDIHIEPQANKISVRYRIDGLLREATVIPMSWLAPLVSRVKIMSGMDISVKRLPQDGRALFKTASGEVDLRVSSVPTIYGERVAIRILNKTAALLSLSQLGFAPTVLERYRKLIAKPSGMILITGPTGSGKTTTLMATLKELNSPRVNIMTVEDPVEYEIEGVNQIQVNEKAGLDFPKVLRSILRQDPDIIMVGEIRDRETADIAIRAALTGHLVFATIHTNDAPSALVRLIEMGIEPFLVASAINAVLAQRLVRRLCPQCKGQPDPARQCTVCGNTGYRGRVGLFELMVVTEQIRRLALEKAPADKIRQTAIAEGMTTLREDGEQKVKDGITTWDEVVRVVYSD